jgi:predicted PurR-regulated permease PerM
MIKYKEYFPVILLLILAILSVLIMKPFFLAIFSGALLAYLAYPLYAWLASRLKKRSLMALLVCILALIILIVPSIFLAKVLIEESMVIYVAVKQKLSEGLFSECQNEFCRMVEGILEDPAVSERIQGMTKLIIDWVINRASNLLVSIPSILINIFITFFVMFYFLKDGEKFIGKINEILRMQESKYNQVMGRLKEIIHGVVYGYFLIAIIQGILGVAGFLLFGLPSPYFWGMMIGILGLIPYMGTGLVWGPTAVYMILEGAFQDSTAQIVKGVGFFLYGLLIISGADNLLRPKLIGKKAKIHPIVIMLGLFGGLYFFGPLGIFVGPLVLSLTVVFLELYFFKKDEPEKYNEIQINFSNVKDDFRKKINFLFNREKTKSELEDKEKR